MFLSEDIHVSRVVPPGSVVRGTSLICFVFHMGAKMGQYRNDLWNSPESHLLDPMLFPNLERVVLESSEQVWHPARDDGIDSKFVNHFSLIAGVL